MELKETLLKLINEKNDKDFGVFVSAMKRKAEKGLLECSLQEFEKILNDVYEIKCKETALQEEADIAVEKFEGFFDEN